MTKEEFVKELILTKWDNMKTFAESTGIPYTTLITILKNNINRASVDNVIKIAKGLGTNVEGLERMYRSSIGNVTIVSETPVPYLVSNKLSSVQIPYYGDIAAEAFATINAVTEEKVRFIPITELFIGRQGSEDLIAFNVNGESMNKVIPHGSTVVAKKVNAQNLKNDEIVIFSHDGQYSMKRFRKDEQDQVLIFSPESWDKKFRDTVIPYSTENDIKIYAKVIWYGVSI